MELSKTACLEILKLVGERGTVRTRGGVTKHLGGAISLDEARFLFDLVMDHHLKRTLETGVANGYSTLALTLAASLADGHHIGVDPCQKTDHDEAAIVLLEEFDVVNRFQLLDGPGHIKIPELITQDRQFDLVFIDGMHNFDYKLVDVFFADQVLRPSGFLVLHDLLLPSVKKVYRYIRGNYHYQVVSTPSLQPPLARKMRYLIGAFLKRRSLWHFWPNSYSNLLVLKKLENNDQPWDFYRNF